MNIFFRLFILLRFKNFSNHPLLALNVPWYYGLINFLAIFLISLAVGGKF